MPINLEEKLNELLQHYESEILEFKGDVTDSYKTTDIGKYFSALSNEVNLKDKEKSGWLIFGVNDKREIVGTTFREKSQHLHKLKQTIAQMTGSLTFEEIHEVNTPNGRVILFQIPPATRGLPTTCNGHAYGRNGESLVALSDNKRQRICDQDIKVDWSKAICPGATIDDLDPAAIQFARKQYTKKNPHLSEEIPKWDDLTFLNKAKVCIQGKITRTAILLLGKDESSHFIDPGVAQITWILKDRDNIEEDHQHFHCPFLLNVDNVYQKVRQLKFRYIREIASTLFPEEVDSYDPDLIREALHNCIAHQDYSLGQRITFIETAGRQLIFTNGGTFIPESVENVVNSDAPESNYRNPFLATAMVNLNMIDTIGSGIKTMFKSQRKKFFPMPDYSFDDQKVKVVVTGRVLDIKYARQLAQMDELSLNEIILLDKVQKKKPLSDEETKLLRDKGLIEGNRPNIHISAEVAKKTGQKEDYIRNRGQSDEFYQKMILDYLDKFGEAKRENFDELLLDKLPDILDKSQKLHKIKNLLQSLRRRQKKTAYDKKSKKWSLKKK